MQYKSDAWKYNCWVAPPQLHWLLRSPFPQRGDVWAFKKWKSYHITALCVSVIWEPYTVWPLRHDPHNLRGKWNSSSRLIGCHAFICGEWEHSSSTCTKKKLLKQVVLSIMLLSSTRLATTATTVVLRIPAPWAIRPASRPLLPPSASASLPALYAPLRTPLAPLSEPFGSPSGGWAERTGQTPPIDRFLSNVNQTQDKK